MKKSYMIFFFFIKLGYLLNLISINISFISISISVCLCVMCIVYVCGSVFPSLAFCIFLCLQLCLCLCLCLSLSFCLSLSRPISSSNTLCSRKNLTLIFLSPISYQFTIKVSFLDIVTFLLDLLNLCGSMYTSQGCGSGSRYSIGSGYVLFRKKNSDPGPISFKNLSKLLSINRPNLYMAEK